MIHARTGYGCVPLAFDPCTMRSLLHVHLCVDLCVHLSTFQPMSVLWWFQIYKAPSSYILHKRHTRTRARPTEKTGWNAANNIYISNIRILVKQHTCMGMLARTNWSHVDGSGWIRSNRRKKTTEFSHAGTIDNGWALDRWIYGSGVCIWIS